MSEASVELQSTIYLANIDICLSRRCLIRLVLISKIYTVKNKLKICVKNTEFTAQIVSSGERFHL